VTRLSKVSKTLLDATETVLDSKKRYSAGALKYRQRNIESIAMSFIVSRPSMNLGSPRCADGTIAAASAIPYMGTRWIVPKASVVDIGARNSPQG